MKLIKFFTLLVLPVLLLPALLMSCGGGAGGGGSSSGASSGTTSVVINLGQKAAASGDFSAQSRTIPSGVNSIIIRISGPSMSTMQDTFDVNYGETVARTYQVLSGDSRLFEALAYSDRSGGGSLLYSGSCSANLSGATASVPIDMQAIYPP